jgi:hypothetical protein
MMSVPYVLLPYGAPDTSWFDPPVSAFIESDSVLEDPLKAPGRNASSCGIDNVSVCPKLCSPLLADP